MFQEDSQRTSKNKLNVLGGLIRDTKFAALYLMSSFTMPSYIGTELMSLVIPLVVIILDFVHK